MRINGAKQTANRVIIKVQQGLPEVDYASYIARVTEGKYKMFLHTEKRAGVVLDDSTVSIASKRTSMNLIVGAISNFDGNVTIFKEPLLMPKAWAKRIIKKRLNKLEQQNMPKVEIPRLRESKDVFRAEVKSPDEKINQIVHASDNKLGLIDY